MNRQEVNLVAVFGSLREGLNNHRLIQNSELVGTTKTDPIFTMTDFGAFPGLLHKGFTEVVIEVYKVLDQQTFDRLDMLEGYPDFYNKMYINTEFGMAIIYYNPDNERNNSVRVVENGDWVKYLNGTND